MNWEQFQRNDAIIGRKGTEKLMASTVLVAGIGGVGGFATEALARAGVGRIILVDSDEVDITNLNRQIIATHDTIGQPKVKVMEERIRSIVPFTDCVAMETRITEESLPDLGIEPGKVDYVVDAIDDVAGKVALIEYCKKAGVPVISSMGCANKTDPTRFRVADIYETSVCPLAKKVRKEMRNRNIDHLKVVYSTEEPLKTGMLGSMAYVPSVCGLIIAGEVISDLVGDINKED